MGQNSAPWYAGGLHFECMQCGTCCAGPEPGFIWVSGEEIEFIARFLDMTAVELTAKYLMRVGPKMSIIEHEPSNDCIFLENVMGQKRCKIYPVRPNQCRTWPFWNSNLINANAWNQAARRCGGINRGKCHTLEEIEKKHQQKQWW